MYYFGIIATICFLHIPNGNAKPWKAEPWLGPRLQPQAPMEHVPTLQSKLPVSRPGILLNNRISPLVPISPEPTNNNSDGQDKLPSDITKPSTVDDSNAEDLKFLKVDTLLGTPLSVMLKKIKESSSTVTEKPEDQKAKPTSKERKRSTNNADNFTPSYRRRQTFTPHQTDGGFVLDSLFPTSPGIVNPLFGAFPQNSIANLPLGFGRQDLLLQSGLFNPQLGGYNPYSNLGFQYPFTPPFPSNLNFINQIPQFGGLGPYYPGVLPFGGYGGFNPLFNPFQRLVRVPVPLPVVGQSLGSIVPTQNFGNGSSNNVEQFSLADIPLQIPLRPQTTFVQSGFQTGRDITNMQPLGSSFAGANPFVQSTGNRNSSPDHSVEVAPFNSVTNNGQQGQQVPFQSTNSRGFPEVFQGQGHLNDDELFPFLRRPQPLRVELPLRQTHGRNSQEIAIDSEEDQRRNPERMRPSQKPKVKSNSAVRVEPRSNESPKPVNHGTKATTTPPIVSTTPTALTTAERRTKLPLIKSSKKIHSKTTSKNSANSPTDTLSKKSPAVYMMRLFYPHDSHEIQNEDIYPGVLRTPYLLGQREEGGRGPILHVGDPQLADRLRDLYGKQDEENIKLPPVYIPPTLCRGPHGSVPCDYIETENHDVEGLNEFPESGIFHQQNHVSAGLLGQNIDFLRGGTFAPGPKFQKLRDARENNQWKPMVYTRPKFRLPNGSNGHLPRL